MSRPGEVATRSRRFAAVSAAGYRGLAAAPRPRLRIVLAWVFGAAGLASYNWWALVPLKPGLMSSPNELFSNLEVTGQPYAAAMQHADVVSGLLLLAAFLIAWRGPSRSERREWLAMLGFAAAGAAGGLFPEVCADGVNGVCRRMEYRLALPASQYIHMVAGILEFAAITLALLWAVQRTRRQSTRPAAVYRRLRTGAFIGYPLLGAAYLFDRLGGLMEVAFFVGFSVMVITYIAERTTATRTAARATAPTGQYCRV